MKYLFAFLLLVSCVVPSKADHVASFGGKVKENFTWSPLANVGVTVTVTIYDAMDYTWETIYLDGTSQADGSYLVYDTLPDYCSVYDAHAAPTDPSKFTYVQGGALQSGPPDADMTTLLVHPIR